MEWNEERGKSSTISIERGNRKERGVQRRSEGRSRAGDGQLPAGVGRVGDEVLCERRCFISFSLTPMLRQFFASFADQSGAHQASRWTHKQARIEPPTVPMQQKPSRSTSMCAACPQLCLTCFFVLVAVSFLFAFGFSNVSLGAAILKNPSMRCWLDLPRALTSRLSALCTRSRLKPFSSTRNLMMPASSGSFHSNLISEAGVTSGFLNRAADSAGRKSSPTLHTHTANSSSNPQVSTRTAHTSISKSIGSLICSTDLYLSLSRCLSASAMLLCVWMSLSAVCGPMPRIEPE